MLCEFNGMKLPHLSNITLYQITLGDYPESSRVAAICFIPTDLEEPPHTAEIQKTDMEWIVRKQ